MTMKTKLVRPVAVEQQQDVDLPEHNYEGRLTCRAVLELPGLRGFKRGYLLEKEAAGSFFVGLEAEPAGPRPELTLIQPHSSRQVVNALCRHLAERSQQRPKRKA